MKGAIVAQKGKRPLVNLTCQECKRRNYVTTRNVINTPKKLELKKFCKFCGKYTLHKETKLPNPKKQ